MSTEPGPAQALPLVAGAVSTEPGPAQALPLVAEACKKSGLLWLTLPDAASPGRARPAWHVWTGGAAYVVCGGREQPLPGLDTAGTVDVTVRSKDKGGRLVTWRARPEVLAPGSPDWALAATELAGQRLNARDATGQLARWASESLVVRLTPTGDLPEQPGSMPTSSGSAAPAPTPAVTAGRLPFVLGRRKHRGGPDRRTSG